MEEQLPETSEIKRLGEDTVRRITAEQAISDLASIVKELVDNALDAESTTIKIRLFGQGLDIIEVSDDGNGVPIGSRPYMATRHATSKIECLEDIYSGTGLTMGFRGEALFAMACVSDSLVVASRTEDDELATKIVFGKDGRPVGGSNNNENTSGDSSEAPWAGDPLARKVGTTVAVVQPFANLPARRADLVRRIKQERTRIFKLVESYGIFNVGVCFRLMDINNHREDVALATSASSTKLEETASTLLGPAFLKGTTSLEVCLESFFRDKRKEKGGNASGEEDIRYNWGIRGLISVDPSLAAAAAQQQKRQRRGGTAPSSKSASNRARIVQYYSINGRVVELPKVTALLKRLWTIACNTSTSMGVPASKAKKPSAILEFTLPNDAFDINLSPDKKSVLLTHEEELLRIIEENVSKMWTDESSNIFVNGSLSQLQDQREGRSQTNDDSSKSNALDPTYENDGEHNSRSEYEYGYDEDDRYKHKRRFAFVHDISKAKMQHDMAERRQSQVVGQKETEDLFIKPTVENDQQTEEGKSLKQTKLSPILKPRNFAQTTNGGGEAAKTPKGESEAPPGKETKPSPEQSPSATATTAIEDPPNIPSPEDRVSDLDRRNWTEVQSKFSRDNDETNELRKEHLSRSVSCGDSQHVNSTSKNAAITPENSGINLLSSSLNSAIPSTTTKHDSNKHTSDSSRQRRANLQDFAFQSDVSKKSVNDIAYNSQQTTRTNPLLPEESSPTSNYGDGVCNETESATLNKRKRNEREENESIPLPLTDHDRRIQNNRISKELENADANLNVGMNDGNESSDEQQQSNQVVWGSFSSTEDICLSARIERLNMRKRKRDIDDIRRRIRLKQGGANTIKTEESRRRNSMNQGFSKDEVDKKVTFDDGGDCNDDTSGFIRMPKSTFRNGMEVIGQFNLGFILARCSRNHLWILDQHACDEQYNYEQLIKNTVMHQQPLIRPLPIELSPSEEACVLDHMDIFEANGFRFSYDDQAPIRHRLSLTSLPHSGAHEGRKAVQFGPSDVSALCSVLTEGSSYDAGSGGTGADGSGTYGNNAVRRNAGNVSSSDRSDRLIARLPKAIAMFASRACRTSIMIGDALSQKEMNSVVQKLAKVDVPWNCPHGRPTMRHVANVLPMLLKDERRAAEHIAVPTVTVIPMTQDESHPGN